MSSLSKRDIKSLNDLDYSINQKLSKRDTKSLNDISKLKKQYLYNFFKKKDLKIEMVDGFKLYIIPEGYYIWKGIKTKNRPYYNWYREGITDKKIILKKIPLNFFASKDVASLYGSKKKKDDGIDLQFRIIKPMKLLDIGDIANIKIMWRYFKNFTENDILNSEYLSNDYKKEFDKWNNSDSDSIKKKRYPTKKEFIEKFISNYLLEPLINTIGNYETYSNNKIKTPTKAERKSEDWMDEELVKIICNFFKFDGWIYFKNTETTFHDEILLCKNGEEFLEYVGAHKI